MAIGHFLMAIEGGVPVRAAGADCSESALFKGNIATQVGELYGPNDLRRAMAFQIFYIFINVSVIVAPLISGTLGQKVGWHYGFGCAGVVMVLGLIIYLSGRRWLPPDERPHAEGGPREAREPLTRDDWMCVLYLVILIPVLPISLLTNQEIFNAYLVWGDQQFDLRFMDSTMPSSWLITLDATFSFSMLVAVAAFWKWWGLNAPRARRDQQDDHRQRLHDRRRPVPVHGRADPARGRQDRPVLADDVPPHEQHRLRAHPADQPRALLEDRAEADHRDGDRPLLSRLLHRRMRSSAGSAASIRACRPRPSG